MRRLPASFLIVLAVIAAASLAACSSGAAPSWTYAPAPSTTPAPSGAASGAPSAGASGAPSPSAVAPSASAGQSAAASGGAGAALTVAAPVGAATTGFDPTTLEAAADTAFTLTFDNQDNQAPHNLVLQDASGTAVAVEGDTAPFTGPGTRTYQVPALAAGDYKYVCQVHLTTMTGTLSVN